MALTVLQNCQRIVIFMQLLTLVLVTTFLTIKIIKKKIDVSSPAQGEQGQSVGPKYKESESSINIGKSSFDIPAIKANTFTQYDTCTQRFMKKMCELNVTFNPLLIVMPLNFILGKSYALSVSIYFISAMFCLLFNLFKIHRACIQQKMVRLSLEILWIGLVTFLIVNIWYEKSSSMLYTLKEG